MNEFDRPLGRPLDTYRPSSSSSLGSDLGYLVRREPAPLRLVQPEPERSVFPKREVRVREEWDSSIKGYRRITEERYSRGEPFKTIFRC